LKTESPKKKTMSREVMNMDFDIVGTLADRANKMDGKIVMLVMDGLGGLPQKEGGLTELETAHTPNLDRLARRGICGLHIPVGHGITPGSGPAHLGLFGYDPTKYEVGRGVLAALGINFDLRHGDVAARGNFCTLDDQGKVTDRRAGRIPNETNKKLCAKLRQIEIPGVEVFVETVKEHRFLLVLRGENLSGALADTDPQQVGLAPKSARALKHDNNDDAAVKNTIRIVDTFVQKALAVLKAEQPANGVLMRGFAQRPKWPTMEEVYGLRAAAIAAYPMYRGVAKLIGMTPLETGMSVADSVLTLAQNWDDYDFFYVHVKKTDSAGEDGDFDRKVAVIEETDRALPDIEKRSPAVLMVTGDHSTPALLKSHSWHPVPTLLWSPYCRTDRVETFGERACVEGAIGARLPAIELMPLALANALRLEKFGA
jgi:2,3-bisphosphoglycerate-independent phosphoglycerate mutase